MNVTVRFEGAMKFTGIGPSGHALPLDAAPDVGGTGSGARPMEMLLAALGGCSGMNIVSILNKMRVPYDTLDIRLRGERPGGQPNPFSAVEIEYRFTGENLEDKRAQIERAVRLSHDRYCSVAASLNPDIPITYRIVLEP